VLNELYVAPIHPPHGRDAIRPAASGTPYALNDRLAKTEYIGLGEIEGPEDVILDRDDHLIAARATARSSASSRPITNSSEVFAHNRRPFRWASHLDREGTLACPASARWDSMRSPGQAR
jgi:ribose transport system permease protein